MFYLKMAGSDGLQAILCLTLCLSQLSEAIVDPGALTTKPPKHREPIVPWYLNGKQSQPPVDLSRSGKWEQSEEVSPRRPVIVNSGTWSNWRKAPDSDIEQRSEQSQGFDQSQGFEQSENFEQSQGFAQTGSWEQTVTHDRTQGYEEQHGNDGDGNGSYGGFGGQSHKTETWNAENGADRDSYAEFAADNKKPHKGKIVVSKKPSSAGKIAKYDDASGVQCPSSEATGQFVYPPDCKFFVNCWQGRAFVQPCAPGTVFNPESLECDFPHKVKCYGSELADFTTNSNKESAGRREPLVSNSYPKYVTPELQEPTCPSQVNGLLAHPADCTKYLQCVNGVTHIMDCGPGTVFNTAISVCDWPHNVKGCEDAGKSVGEITEIPVPPDADGYDVDRAQPTEPSQTVRKVECPPNHTGLIAHPTDCKKFLQCANGITYVMDCGPGTVFNPITTVCDWPYNVEGCGKGGSVPNTNVHPTTDRQWPGNDQGHSNAGQHSSQPTYGGQRHNRTQGNSGQHNWQGQVNQHGTSGQDQQGSSYGYYDQHGIYHRREENHQQSEGVWQNGQTGRDDSAGQISGHHHPDHHSPEDGQWNQNHPHGDGDNTGDDSGDDQPSYHQTTGQWNYHHQHHNHHGIESTDNSPDEQNSHVHHHYHNQNSAGTEESYQGGNQQGQNGPNQQGSSHGYYDQYGNYHRHEEKLQQGQGKWQNGHTGTSWGHHHGQSATGDSGGEMSGHHPFHHHTNQNGHGTEGSNQGENANGQGHYDDHSDRRTGSGVTSEAGSGDQPAPTRNIYVDSNYKLPGEIYNGSHHGRDDHVTPWNREEGQISKPGILTPSSWRGQDQEGRGTSSSERTGRVWDQAGVKTGSRDPARDQHSYPIGIYVNEKGIKGHYITKEIEVNQGHSNTRNYGTNNMYPPNVIDKKDYGDSYPGKPPSVRGDPRINSGTKEEPVHEENTGYDSQNSNESDLEAIDSMYHKVFRQNGSDQSVYGQTESTTENGEKREVTERYPDYTVTIGNDYHERDRIDHSDVESSTMVEPGESNFDVDVLDGKEKWKPTLVFKNKTEKKKETAIMKIGKDNVDVDIFAVEIIQDEEEPPFPVYYVPSVQQLGVPRKSTPGTPASGQILRLRGGLNPGEGYLEVQGIEAGWGVVCDSRRSWTLKEADIVCRQLGYSKGAESAWQGRNGDSDIPDWIAADTVDCSGHETKFQSCKFTHGSDCDVSRNAVGLRCLPNRVAHCRQDEVPHQGHCYHLADADSGLNHAEALNYCSSRKARLLDVVSQGENNFISEWLVQTHPQVDSLMTSGVGFSTFNRSIWLWEDSSRAKFRYNKWWPGWLEDKKHPPSVGSRPVCVVMKRTFPCQNHPDQTCVSDYFFWDVEDCTTSNQGHSYVCKRPFDDIGCVYGKGKQYSGKANLTSSGKECLPWNHEQIGHHLMVKVVSQEVREKLKEHNFCRNPNPNEESKPWCFTGPYGELDYCDIPPCANLGSKKSIAGGGCKPKHFECTPGECIPSPWICDGEEDCTNGADEQYCSQHLQLFNKTLNHRLEGYDVEKWLNTPVKTCALRCKDADFTCRSFSHKADDNVCLLSDSNVGLTGALVSSTDFDYYEMTDRSINCDGMYTCGNQKCINQSQVCDGKNNCGDRTDENICTVDNLGYEIRLAGSKDANKGRVEVKVLGQWGQVCDDGFGMIDAGVVCKELGFELGAVEVRHGGFFGNMDPPSLFLVDQLECRGNETSLRECDFDGWGVHDCQPEEAVGVVCKTPVESCKDGYWKCDESPECIPTSFICDEVVDCDDRSDESSEHCDAPFELRLAGGNSPLEGRVEVRHHGIWGTVCDDDFSKATATVICRSLGYGGPADAMKNGAFGPGEGPIWLDEVFCRGNETALYRCQHNQWGQHNCGHNEDAGVVCTSGEVTDYERPEDLLPDLSDFSSNDLLPAECGQRAEDYGEESIYMARVVRGSVAPRGAYPWQASIRVRGNSRSNHWCGAVVISPLYVLTAAHCLEGYNKGIYFVRAGDYNTEIDEGTEVDANIEDYYIHEDFRKGQRMNNDIALVKLKGPGIPLGSNIMPICLPPENIEYLPGLNCTISGFGSIESGNSAHSRDLRYGWVPLLDQSVCRAGYVYGEGAISDGMVCAGHLDENVDTCDGDSGGPLACYHNGAFTLYGLTSWGLHCGEVNKPGVYVRIALYRSWIDQKIRESMSGR